MSLIPRESATALLKLIEGEYKDIIRNKQLKRPYNEYIIKAKKIYEEIEKRVKKMGKLYRDGVTYDDSIIYIYTFDYALIALRHRMLGQIDKAEEIYHEIYSRIGKDRELYVVGVNLPYIRTDANAAMAILHWRLGHRDKAKKIYYEINERIGKEGWLYKSGIDDPSIRTDANAAMGIFCHELDKIYEAKMICHEIENKIEKDGELYKSGAGECFIPTAGNVEMEILYYLLGGMVIE